MTSVSVCLSVCLSGRPGENISPYNCPQKDHRLPLDKQKNKEVNIKEERNLSQGREVKEVEKA